MDRKERSRNQELKTKNIKILVKVPECSPFEIKHIYSSEPTINVPLVCINTTEVPADIHKFGIDAISQKFKFFWCRININAITCLKEEIIYG
jgi:hypothetical protein